MSGLDIGVESKITMSVDFRWLLKEMPENHDRFDSWDISATVFGAQKVRGSSVYACFAIKGVMDFFSVKYKKKSS